MDCPSRPLEKEEGVGESEDEDGEDIQYSDEDIVRILPHLQQRTGRSLGADCEGGEEESDVGSIGDFIAESEEEQEEEGEEEDSGEGSESELEATP